MDSLRDKLIELCEDFQSSGVRFKQVLEMLRECWVEAARSRYRDAEIEVKD